MPTFVCVCEYLYIYICIRTNVCPFALRLVVTATDRGSPRLAGSATLTVIITDLNDNSPMIPLPQEIHVPESKSALATG